MVLDDWRMKVRQIAETIGILYIYIYIYSCKMIQ